MAWQPKSTKLHCVLAYEAALHIVRLATAALGAAKKNDSSMEDMEIMVAMPWKQSNKLEGK